MNAQKIEPQLQNALAATPLELSRAPELAFGRLTLPNASIRWEVIVRYYGSWEAVAEAFPAMNYTLLLGQFAIAALTEAELYALTEFPQILYIEKTKRFFYETYHSKKTLSPLPVPQHTMPAASLHSQQTDSLSGQGVLVAVIDSGIDYFHPDFRNPDGTTRIKWLWDQTLSPDAQASLLPPDGYSIGALFDESRINDALNASSIQEALTLCPSTDASGHGTFVAGVAAGNGAASAGVFRGIAYEATLLVVKVQSASPQSPPGTAALLQAIDFCVQESRRINLPLSINLSYGNSYGAHAGNALLEKYIDRLADFAKCSISVGSGNEGASAGHTGTASQMQRNELLIGEFVSSLSVQFWKNYTTELALSIVTPAGNSLSIPNQPGVMRYRLDNVTFLISYGEPTPYSTYQEIYMEFFPDEAYLTPGIWQFVVTTDARRPADYQLWLPVANAISGSAAFLQPNPSLTLTIPSSAASCITVGAYDSLTDTYAPFSGRGDERIGAEGSAALLPWSTYTPKPDLVAPGVGITSCAPGGGYTQRTGTSMATPFVSGSAALLMQWGIVMGNDPFLFGEKLKAYLCKSARPLPGFSSYPNAQIGWGALRLPDL